VKWVKVGEFYVVPQQLALDTTAIMDVDNDDDNGPSGEIVTLLRAQLALSFVAFEKSFQL
jgi:hypothetical protein